MLTGDVHSENAKALGCDRDTAKTFLYAISYGAGVSKLASILGCTAPAAKKKIKSFWKTNVGIAELKESLEHEYEKKGYIQGLDGRPLYIRSRHKLLNTLIQNAATVVFKQWMVLCWLHEEEDMATQILAYHDELAWEIRSYRKETAIMKGEVFCKLAGDAGDDLEVQLPITAAFKVGKSYDEVH